MTVSTSNPDAVIIGGGYNGAAIAIYLVRQRGLRRTMHIEKEAKLLCRASYHNQARMHSGYHHPRSFTTAFRSQVNVPRFVRDWPRAVKRDFIEIYVIVRRNMKITARQFERFCHEIRAKIKPTKPGLKKLFEPRLIEEVFLVEEYACDATQLARCAGKELHESGVEVRFSSRATAISRSDQDRSMVTVQHEAGNTEPVDCPYVFNCTCSGLNQFQGDFPGTQTSLEHEVTEMALMRMPQPFKDLGVTVMDGRGENSCKALDTCDHATCVDRMIRHAGRYLPFVLDARYVESLFEIKTVLVKNEGEDGRPILFEKHHELPGCSSVLGGKIDNKYLRCFGEVAT